VCRRKNLCCSLRRSAPQELDPIHTVPAHRGMHCSINTTIMICDTTTFHIVHCLKYSSYAQSVEPSEIRTGYLQNTRQKKPTSLMWEGNVITNHRDFSCCCGKSGKYLIMYSLTHQIKDFRNCILIWSRRSVRH
jgi:hypothetical protein